MHGCVHFVISIKTPDNRCLIYIVFMWPYPQITSIKVCLGWVTEIISIFSFLFLSTYIPTHAHIYADNHTDNGLIFQSFFFFTYVTFGLWIVFSYKTISVTYIKVQGLLGLCFARIFHETIIFSLFYDIHFIFALLIP